MSIGWYDRTGKKITAQEAEVLLPDMEYKRVALHEEDGYKVSTVWLGLNHSWNGGEPLIFETMIFDAGWTSSGDYQERYSTEAEARAGHERAVAHLRAEILGKGTKLEDLPTNDAWNTYDWERTWSGIDYNGTFAVGIGGARLDDMSADRIAEVLHFSAYSPEGFGSVDFFAVVRLVDGQFAVSEAWADTTGWGCQADAWWKVGPTYESVLNELSEANRDRIAPVNGGAA